MATMAVYLHANLSLPDFVTDDPHIVGGIIAKFGNYASQLVFANELANALADAPITDDLANAEDVTMVRVAISGQTAQLLAPLAPSHPSC